MPQPQPLTARVNDLVAAARHAAQLATTGDWHAALPAFAALDQLADACLHAAVEAARADGWSWPKLGRALGTSQQAAWKRFSGNAPHRRPTSSPPPPAPPAGPAPKEP